MPTVAEKLSTTKAAIAQLLKAAAPPETTPTEQTLPAAEVVASVSAELKGEVTKERAAYLAGVLEALSKNNWEATSFIPIKELKDPMKIEPQEVSIATLQNLAAGKPDSLFATNLSTAKKAAIIAKLAMSPELIRKSAMTDKLEEIKGMFGLSEDDMDQSYEVRYKVGNLIDALINAIKLENLIGTEKSEPAEKTTAPEEKKPEEKKPETVADDVWPADMASAQKQFDPVSKAYKKAELTWGYDSERK